ncbi:MAG: NUDIX hydrolase [Desulfobulbaceae bacterium]|nr:NUDIX hydrolase [Desulfobulbaceae bacterium]
MISKKVVWSSPWYSIRQDELIDSGGNTFVYNVVEKPDTVWILPVTTRHQVVLIRHFRHTVNRWCWEIPAGNQIQGMTLRESAEIELKEEVGGIAQHLECIGEFYAACGMSSENNHLYLATEVTLDIPDPEPAEVIEIHPLPIVDVITMARENQFQSGPSALAIFLCEQRLKKLI